MGTYNLKLNRVKQKVGLDIDDKMLFNILFDMNRYYDKDFVDNLHKKNIIVNQSKRNILRKYYYYGNKELLVFAGINDFNIYEANIEAQEKVLDSFIKRCEIYDENKIISSIKERYNSISKQDENCAKWLKYYDNKRNKLYKYSMAMICYDQKEFANDNFELNEILRKIVDTYDGLENYRYLIFYLEGKLFDKNLKDVTWNVLYKVGLFCENFIQYRGKFYPFKRDKKIAEMKAFLNNKFGEEIDYEFVENFYSSISCGFKFEDCFISDNQEKIILTFQKIKLDESKVPCPACLSTIQSGNSYPEVLKKSFECKNPKCPERSKSGRGKRFDEYGTYRYFKLVENKNENQVSDELYAKWRKDIFNNDNNVFEMLIKYYSFDNETLYCNRNISKCYLETRHVLSKTTPNNDNYIKTFEELPIYKLLNAIKNKFDSSISNEVLHDRIYVLNENSTMGLKKLKKGQVNVAITSPPYYNAREYSNWSNLILYLVDMMDNANSVYSVLNKDGYYFYNIGDIVDCDNIYVSSNMSKKRLQLGFYSSMIFELVGFNLVGNIIWNKGEVQSKRNATINHNSGYIKCVNCYEHVLVFKKGIERKIISSVRSITPVIKINCKGENRVKHTAPYPEELVDVVSEYVNKDKYVLDPFLGSGTTLKWCKKHGIKGIGYEVNKEYYKLAKKNLAGVK